MKTMKCSELGGPDSCNEEFHAETFEEMGEQSKKHAMENMETHKEAMGKMKKMMEEGTAQKWHEEKKAEFEALSED